MTITFRFILITIISFGWLTPSYYSHAQSKENEERVKANFPHSDIILFDLSLNAKDGLAQLANPINTTKRQGYDNQPYFTHNSESFIYSRGDDYQTDVYEYTIASQKIRQLSDSAATEFSPTPNKANTSILFVSDRNGSVWQGQRANLNHPVWFLQKSNNAEPIGYFALNEETQDFLYWSRYGFSLKLVNHISGSYHFVTGNAPPSTPHVIPQTQYFSFVHRQVNEQVWIKMLDPKSKAITPLIAITGSNYNYTWAPDQTLFMIQANVLYQAKPLSSATWHKVTDLAVFGIKRANRLAISPNGKFLAMVGEME